MLQFKGSLFRLFYRLNKKHPCDMILWYTLKERVGFYGILVSFDMFNIGFVENISVSLC